MKSMLDAWVSSTIPIHHQIQKLKELPEKGEVGGPSEAIMQLSLVLFLSLVFGHASPPGHN